MTPTLSKDCPIDLQTLVDTRLLVQANSGGGKSHCIRRILEQTHGQVQHLVIDMEGEFSTLREKFDYVLAAPHGGDTVANPRSAALLARRLLELNVSAILDIYELKAHERISFVKQFLDSLINAPKDLWHPALVVVDEAHVFCPQKGEAESASSVIDLATRGRKRGFCAVLATQRLSKLHKDAAAECNNKLIGRTSLDVDLDRAIDELGLKRENRHLLRDLVPGEFYIYGPALLNGPERLPTLVGPVKTTHPKAGARLNFTAPPPTSKIKALLPKLADLPAEAEQKAKTEAELKQEITNLKRALTLAEKGQKQVEVEKVVLQPMVPPAVLEKFQQVQAENRDLMTALENFGAELRAIAKMGKLTPSVPVKVQMPIRSYAGDAPAVTTPKRYVPTPKFRAEINSDNLNLGKCEKAILIVLANQPDGCEAGRLTLLAGYRYSGGFKNALSTLRQLGLMEGENTGTMRITEKGHAEIGPVDDLPSGKELAAYWLKHPSLGKCEQAILRALIEEPEGMTAPQLCNATDPPYQYSGGFKNALSNLRTAGLLIGKNTEVMKVNEDLL